jgi:predicted metalloprotease with PDZ domain
VVFTNEGRTAADLIRFRIDFGTESLAIRDAGSFAPGVTITHVFKRRGGNIYASPLFAPAKLRCSVDAVHFKDGSEWTSAAADANAARAASTLSGSGWIGVQMDQTPQGVVAHLLIPSGPARAAGMMQGDIIQKVDDQRVVTVAEALTLISSAEPGSRLKITVLRDDQKHDFLVIVGRRPT